nr:hypothetical protein [Flavobacterium sp.]
MRKLSLLLAVGILATVCSCKEEEPEKPKVIYEDTSKSRQSVKVDTTRIEIADLPIHFPGTDYLIHPVGDFRANERSRTYGYERGGFTISNFSEYEITGFLHNLMFQKISSDSLVPLTDKRVLIQTATFLKLTADRTKQQIMVYTMADSDTNKDGRLDVNDIRALYIGQVGDEMIKI